MENIVADSCPWPWLVFLGRKRLESQMFSDVVSDQKITGVVRSIPKLNIDYIFPTNINGWFLLIQGEASMCLWNADTLQSIDLPKKLEELENSRLEFFWLTNSPDDRKCVILLLVSDSPTIMYCKVYGDDHWTFRDYGEEIIEVRGHRKYSGNRFYNPFAYDDNIFAITSFHVVTKIEIKKPKRLVLRPDLSFHSFRVPRPHVVGPCIIFDHLVPCCSELFVITVACGVDEDQISSPIVSIDVFKLDFSDMSCKIVDGCPNVAFFLSDNQWLACPIAPHDSNKVGNRVYIVASDNNDNDDDEKEEDCPILYTYHIQQKTLRKSLIDTPKDKKSKPYWMLIPDARALAKTRNDYHINEGDGEKDQLFVKTGNTDYKDEEKEYPVMLDDLHTDILKIILSYLINPLDYLNFRAINRSCRELGSIREWRNITSGNNDFFINTSPWLIFPNSQQVGKSILYMVDPVSRNKYFVRIPKILEENSRICYSAYGWLLMSSPYLEDGIVTDLNLVLYNPITKSTICLSKLPSHARHFFFHDSPKHVENFFTIGISIDERGATYYILDKVNNEESNTDSIPEWEWAAEDMAKDYKEGKFCVRQYNINAIYYDDGIYFLVGDGNLEYFSDDYEFILRIHTLEEPCNKSLYERCFLARCDNDLLSIYIGKEWKWLKAFKFNKLDKVWVEVNELKNNNCLYMSYVSSTTSEPQSPEVGNRIYFSMFYQGSIVYYSFNTQKFHLSDGMDSVMSDSQGLEEQMYSCWFEPRWELEE